MRCPTGRKEEGLRDFRKAAPGWPGFASARNKPAAATLWNRWERAEALECPAAACAGDPGKCKIALAASRIHRAAGRNSEVERACGACLLEKGRDEAVWHAQREVSGGA